LKGAFDGGSRNQLLEQEPQVLSSYRTTQYFGIQQSYDNFVVAAGIIIVVCIIVVAAIVIVVSLIVVIKAIVITAICWNTMYLVHDGIQKIKVQTEA
jgi:hypothetical protein